MEPYTRPSTGYDQLIHIQVSFDLQFFEPRASRRRVRMTQTTPSSRWPWERRSSRRRWWSRRPARWSGGSRQTCESFSSFIRHLRLSLIVQVDSKPGKHSRGRPHCSTQVISFAGSHHHHVRNLLGVDQFLGRVVLPLKDFDHTQRPTTRFQAPFFSLYFVSDGTHCSASRGRRRRSQVTEES